MLNWHKQNVVLAQEENNFHRSWIKTNPESMPVQYWKTHKNIAYLG